MVLPPAPNPPNISAAVGTKPQAADFYGWWYLNSLFFQQKVVFRGRQLTTTSSIAADGNPHNIGIDTVDEDPWSGWNAGTVSWSPKIDGWYQITVCAFMAALSAGVMLVPEVGGSFSQRLRVLASATAHTAGAEGQYLAYLRTTSTVKAQAALLNAGAAISTSNTAGQNSSLEIVWLGS